MLTDAHYHPFYLLNRLPQTNKKHRQLKILAAASACNLEEFIYNEELARKIAAENSAQIFPCFAIHPQQLTTSKEQSTDSGKQAAAGNEQKTMNERLAELETLAAEGRLTAVGECGFDLFNAAFKETEAAQNIIFAEHLEIAIKYDLPVVVHIRRAIHKIYAAAKTLARCRAVVFHSWPGTFEEGQALLRRRVNAYYSFGNTVINGHKHAKRCCALFPAERLLTETDAPYQAQRGKDYSHWEDLPVIIETIAALRREIESPITTVQELETQIETNFRNIYMEEF